MAQVCFPTVVYTTYVECTDWYKDINENGIYDEGVDPYTNTTCDDPYTVMETFTVCSVFRYNSQSGSFEKTYTTTAGGTEGGYNPPEEQQPCDCTNTCSICGKCIPNNIKNAMVIDPCDYCTGHTNLPKVIIDSTTFKGTKAECVYEKLKNSSLMENLLQDFVGSSKYHVTYTVVPSYIDTYGNEGYGGIINNGDGTMTIKINSLFFDEEVPVSIAKTILHETIHAYIYQEVASLGGYENLENSTIEQLFAYYEWYGGDSFQHPFMSRYYIPKLAEALWIYDGEKYSIDYYEALAWKGSLMGTYDYISKSQEEKDSIEQKISVLNLGSKECID